ncbi:cell division protein FtsQ [Fulvitalea axinellae]|uniref:Cell division protein FtsQ n=1 Tax=Fulvitalea axinellae TaxID=1182444 RepID=A0AAU9D5M3_9BACT|nr:cell division protein FtsQ [Fulvitalea axinellae]
MLKVFSNIKLKIGPKIIGGIVILAGLGWFVAKKQWARRCVRIEVTVDDSHQQFFVSEQSVKRMMTKSGSRKLVGEPLSYINLKEIEKDIEKHKFVQNAEVYAGVSGVLFANVTQNRPIARIVRPRAKDAYINFDGAILPTSSRFTARVPLVSGAYANKFVNGKQDEIFEGVMTVLRKLEEDEFLKAQIAQVDVDKEGRLKIFPQVGKQIFELGLPQDIDRKLQKLTWFYEHIYPFKGPNAYKRVSLEFERQIVCE